MKTHPYFFIVFLLFVSFFAYPQQQRIKFQHLSTNNGLTHSNAACILEDSRGFIWVGTRDGLNRYDGYSFTVYKNDPQNLNSISNNYINAIVEDSQGNLWVGTWGGINYFDRQKDKFFRYMHEPGNPNSLSHDLVRSLLLDSKGNLWIGTEGGGLNYYDKEKNKFTSYVYDSKDPKSLSNNTIRQVYEDDQKNIWIGTLLGGLNKFDRETRQFKRYQHNPKVKTSISSNNAYTIFEDSQKRFWIGTHGGGLNLFDREKEIFQRFQNDPKNPNSLPHNDISVTTEDKEGNLWIGTENGGLSIFNFQNKTFDNYIHDDVDGASLSNNSIYSIYQDSKGNMWIGTFAGGINFYSRDSKRFNHYKHNSSPNSLSHNNVLCIYEDSRDNLWIGTDGGGLNLLDRKTGNFTIFRHDKNNPNSIGEDYVLEIFEDSDGEIWIGTWGGGISVYNQDKKVFRQYKNEPDNPNSLCSNNVIVIQESFDKKMFIGTYRGLGLDVLDRKTGKFTHYTANINDLSSLSNNNIHSIYKDKEGFFWIGTNGGGLNLFNNDNTFTLFKHSDNKNSLSSNIIRCMYEDSKGNFWLGTDAGLNLMDKATKTIIAKYTSYDGLSNDVISGILEDGKGNLWLSTNKGLSRFNYQTKEFKNYTVADGLQANEFRPKAYCRSQSGKMYFGGINGFNEFHPDSLEERSYDPPLVITDFQVFNRPVPIGDGPENKYLLKKHISETDEINLSYKHSVISFEFASLNYTVADKKKYQYILEGFDQSWNNIGTKRMATYTNLDPGEYLFKVKGLDNNGNWSKKTTTIKLTISPPFWKTWWFKTLIILLINGCFITFYKFRIGVVKRQKDQLEKLVKERTEEITHQRNELIKKQILLEEKNNEILSQNEQLIEQQEELESQRKSLEKQNITIAEKNILLQNQQGYLEKTVEERTEELVKMNNELMNKNHRLEQYGFVTSHNFRGPVATLLGLCEIFNKSDIGDPNNLIIMEKTKETTQKIDGMIKDLGMLLDQGKNIVSLFEPIELNSVIENVKVLLEYDIKESNLSINYNFNYLPIISTVPAYINSIFYNLISNAIKFRKENIDPVINIVSNEDGAYNCISFKDNGCGINIGKHGTNIFYPFKRFNTSVPGKGLGLYLVKTQVEAMEGTIQVESEEGVGTSFIIKFPK